MQRMTLMILWLCSAGAHSLAQEPAAGTKPNIILMMTDDQGWGEIGYNGHPYIKTPEIDKMASESLRLDRMYSASAVCSPTRASVMTGRSPYRMRSEKINGIPDARECFLPELLQEKGYATGFFGKWHLGGGAKRGTDKGFGPHERGYQHAIYTVNNSEHVDPAEWFQEGKLLPQLKGESSLLLAEKAIEFIRRNHREEKPFLATVWFHSPHKPYGTTQEFIDLYADYEELNPPHRVYFGQLSAVDRAVGMVRKELRSLGIAENTIIWYCSDNGSEYRTSDKRINPNAPAGRKFVLSTGGILVPGIIEWPTRIKEPRISRVPVVTSDILPTILDMLDMESNPKVVRPLDGISVLPLIEGSMTKRESPIIARLGARLGVLTDGFVFFTMPEGLSKEERRKNGGWLLPPAGSKNDTLYAPDDLLEKNNLVSQHPERVAEFKQLLTEFGASVEQSRAGNDYRD